MEFPKDSPVYCLRWRPRVDVATWVLFICSSSVATLLLLLQPGFLAVASICGRDINLWSRPCCLSFSQKLMSRLGFTSLPRFSCHHFSYELGLLFFVALHVATSVLGCDHSSVSSALTHFVTSFFWLRPRSWSSVFTCSEL